MWIQKKNLGGGVKYEGYLSLAVRGGGPEPYFCNFKCNLKKFGFCKGGPDPLNLPPPPPPDPHMHLMPWLSSVPIKHL